MLLQRLRSDTKEAHQALEKLIIPRIKNIQNNNDYIELLELFYGYFKPIENLLDKHLGNNEIPEYSNRRKSESLIKDILAAGGAPSLKTCNVLPAITNAKEAIGAMYVLEGSTLGGKIISKMIMQCLSLSSDEAISFFTGYREDSDRMWSSFTAALNACTNNPEEQHRIAQAANDTFIKFKNWVELNTVAQQN